MEVLLFFSFIKIDERCAKEEEGKRKKNNKEDFKYVGLACQQKEKRRTKMAAYHVFYGDDEYLLISVGTSPNFTPLVQLLSVEFNWHFKKVTLIQQ